MHAKAGANNKTLENKDKIPCKINIFIDIEHNRSTSIYNKNASNKLIESRGNECKNQRYNSSRRRRPKGII